MSESIGQRELRNDSGAVMRRVEQGESFTITRHGRPVADLVPHSDPPSAAGRSLAELHATFRRLPPMDRRRWEAERDEADATFGDDLVE